MDEFMEASERLQPRYSPGKCNGRLVLFEARESPDTEYLRSGLAESGIEVHTVPASHLDLMEEPVVVETAAIVGESFPGDNAAA
jgi:hypothetical protein